MSAEHQTAENQTAHYMVSVKAAWDKAPEGPKKATTPKTTKRHIPSESKQAAP
ncbi:hypothetical protein TRM7557_01026 [Tritonibacter multivorans]|uniref:Uncharacterized protein n=1 Tax=Tritonibacter multivorans TaxID=928856 RepID=A0A0P1G4W2_9RHOB|nr:hypothetical protein TRM7557_01026 [Tritonibacter multivorans]SFD07858.1 hypothetical protein SAMN04488049_106179 [Tritonibacter multivorans]